MLFVLPTSQCSSIPVPPTPTAIPVPTSTPVPYNPVIALDWDGFYTSDSGVTLDSGSVSSWESQEGGEIFSQATSAQQPPLVDNFFHNKPAIDCHFGSRILQSTTQFLTGNTGYAIFYVQITNQTQVNESALLGTGTSSSNYFSLNANTNSTNKQPGITYTVTGTDDQVKASSTPSLNTSYVLEYYSDGASWHIVRNGANQTLSALTGSNSGAWFGDIAGDTIDLCATSLASAVNIPFFGYVGVVGIIDGSIPTSEERAELRLWITDVWDE